MDEYKSSYLTLWQAVTAAIDALEQGNPDAARSLLIQGQQDAEEAFLSQGESHEA
jgi:hypothetical protein